MEYGADPPDGGDDGFDDEAETGEWTHVPPAHDEAEAGEWAHEPLAAPEPAPVALSETAALSAHLEAIVRAAEESAEQMRAAAEQRAHDRIAEADRAADYRVSAAEEEAAELLAQAQAQAERRAAEAVLAVEGIHAEAQEALREAKATLAQAKLDAEKAAKDTVTVAREQAREIVRAAHLATREVMDDGSELSEQLRELSASLRSNAERLLRDIRLAHGSMTARLDQALPEGAGAVRPRESERERDEQPRAPRRTRPSGGGAPIDFDVPDFVLGDE